MTPLTRLYIFACNKSTNQQHEMVLTLYTLTLVRQRALPS